MPGPHGPVDDVGEAVLRIDVLLEHLTWPECDDATRSNSNFFSSPWIPTFASTFAAHDKISKPRNLDRFPLLQHGLQKIQHKFDDIGCFIFRNTNLLEDLVCNISLSHANPPTQPLQIAVLHKGHLSHRRVLLKLREVMKSVKEILANESGRQLFLRKQLIFDAVCKSLPGGFNDIFRNTDRAPFVFM